MKEFTEVDLSTLKRKKPVCLESADLRRQERERNNTEAEGENLRV